jgi:hypothetical protein
MAAPMRQMSDARVLSHDRRGTHFWPHRAQPFPSPTIRGLLHRPASTPAPKISVSTAPLMTEAAGERRYLTVMFCNLDSAWIAARLNAANLFAQRAIRLTARRFTASSSRWTGHPFLSRSRSYPCRLTEGKCAHVEHIAEAQ